MNIGRKKADNSKVRLRIALVGVFFSALYLAVVARAFYIQVFESGFLARQAAGEYRKTCVTAGKRGAIYDRNGMEMAVTVDTVSIGIHPSLVKEKQDACRMLAASLGMGKAELKRMLSSTQPFVWLKRHASRSEEQAVRSLGLGRAVEFVPEQRRVYPNKTLAAQVIGFAGIDGNGLEGLEYAYNHELKGETIRRTVVKDAVGGDFYTGDIPETKASGNSLVLTIDGTVQCITETVLKEAAEEYGAESGMAVVMDPKSGEVLAMANYPFFDPNDFSAYERKLWRNRTVTDAFEPGSTMKVFLVAGALERGVCAPGSVFFCEEGAYKVYDNLIHDSSAHGWLSLRQIVQYSSNIGAVKVSEILGRKALWETLRSFGFGQKTGIECPGEARGIMSDYTLWTPIDTGAISFGQGIAVSAIQLATALSAIANGGMLARPHVVKAVVDSEGNTVRSYGFEPLRRVISPQTAETLRNIMELVTEDEGTGSRASIRGYTVCGKTGTAQKQAEGGGYTSDRFIASFMGFVPSNDPKIAVLVVLDSPSKNYYGGIVAAPAFRRIAHETLNYLGVPPEVTGGPGSLVVEREREVTG